MRPPIQTTTEELAEQFGLELAGDGTRKITGLAALASAGPEDIAFLANPGYRRHLDDTQAGAVIVSREDANRCPTVALIAKNPYLAWAQIGARLHAAPGFEPGIHPQAIVGNGTRCADSVSIAAGAVIGRGCHIGANARIGPGCVLEDEVHIGANSHLVAQVFIGARAQLGRRVMVHPGCAIGADGFGLVMDNGHWQKVPQLGAVRIGDDCEIGANTTIDRGAVDDTVLGSDVRLDNQVQIAHNVVIGAHTAVAGCVGIAGSTRIGRYCMIAGATGIAGHLEICDQVVITAMSTVLNSITEPGEYGSGIPARPQRSWQRLLVRLKSLEQLARRVKALETRKKGKNKQ